MTTAPSIAAEVRAILAHHGLPHDRPLESVDGFANLVVVSGDLVVRLNTGRLVDAFAHEAEVLEHLPPTIPHARVLAHGQRDSGGEYLVVTRLPGAHAESRWASLTPAQRVYVGRDLGRALRVLHALPRQPWMANPWSDLAVAERRWRDAYHAPEEHARSLVASARGHVAGTDPLLDRIDALVADLPLEPVEDQIFVHTDLHLRNVLVADDGTLSLVDFEGSRLGTRSMELDMLLRSAREYDQVELLTGLRETHPDLLQITGLVNRLVVAEAMWHLVQLHHWQPGQTWTKDPIIGLQRVLDGSFEADLLELGGQPPSGQR